MVGDVLAAARSGQPFSTEGYIKDTYKQILDRTADRAKAQTFASFIPNNLVSIYAVNKEAAKYLRPSFLEFDALRDTFEDFDSVGTYLGIGQEAAQAKKQEIVEANESSLRVEEDPTAGASPAVVAGTAQPTNKSSISTNFKAAGKSALTAFNVVSSDPIVVASESFIGKYHQAQKNESAEYQGLKLKVVPARSIITDLPQREREFLENTPSYEGVKAIIVNADNSPVRIDSQGNIAEEGVLAQYMLNRPELVDGVFVKKTETPISEVASALGVDESVAQEARQKEYRILYNIRKALEQDPNREIYVGISASAGFSVDMRYDNPVSLGDINFKALGEEFIPYVGDGERGTESGHAYFNLSFSSKPLPIDRPGITSVIPAETLAKYIFDQSIPLATRTEVFERLLYIGKNIPKIRLREGKILYNGESVTEDVIASVLKSVTESARGSVNSTYRASVPLNMPTTIDIPYYDQNGKVQYNTLDAVDYLKKYFTTPARLEETTTPYFSLDIFPEEQIAFQADVERLSEQTTSVKEGVSELFDSNAELATIGTPQQIDLTPEQEYSIQEYNNDLKAGVYHYVAREGKPDLDYKVIEVSDEGVLVRNEETKKEKLFTVEEYRKTFNVPTELGFSVLGKFGLAEVYKYTSLLNGTPVYSLELNLFDDKNKRKGLGKDIYKAALQEIKKRNGVLTPGAVVKGNKVWESFERDGLLEKGIISNGETIVILNPNKVQAKISTKAPLINANTAKPVGLQLDLGTITADIANQLKENIISNGLGATFNIQESVDSDITETISKGKQNSCN